MKTRPTRAVVISWLMRREQVVEGTRAGQVGELILVGGELSMERGQIVGREVPERSILQRLEIDPVQHALDLGVVRPAPGQRSGELLGLLGVVTPDGDDDPLRDALELEAVSLVELPVAVAGRDQVGVAELELEACHREPEGKDPAVAPRP